MNPNATLVPQEGHIVSLPQVEATSSLFLLQNCKVNQSKGTKFVAPLIYKSSTLLPFDLDK
jgi:hypothetical protein